MDIPNDEFGYGVGFIFFQYALSTAKITQNILRVVVLKAPTANQSLVMSAL